MRFPIPANDDTRVRSGFLFFPKTINGEVRWLERARWLEKYVWWSMPIHQTGWVPQYWIDEEVT